MNFGATMRKKLLSWIIIAGCAMLLLASVNGCGEGTLPATTPSKVTPVTISAGAV